jgi:hypothetical protein
MRERIQQPAMATAALRGVTTVLYLRERRTRCKELPLTAKKAPLRLTGLKMRLPPRLGPRESVGGCVPFTQRRNLQDLKFRAVLGKHSFLLQKKAILINDKNINRK